MAAAGVVAKCRTSIADFVLARSSCSLSSLRNFSVSSKEETRGAEESSSSVANEHQEKPAGAFSLKDSEGEAAAAEKGGDEEEGPYVNEETGEVGGPRGPEPTRYGDWEKGGRCSDF
ncbi:hypothetical protein R1flu_007732 [Riccia fluitans]|uniref:Succinate dehydrogenase assembly factor 4, mitochondrial n=1 Tax=Riccia fluitans TaxID=41844 RepID=A0ABD1YZX4_9MARC